MRAARLVQLMKSNSAALSEQLVEKIRASEKCGDLCARVPENEHKQYAVQVFHDLTEWLGHESDAIVEARYVGLGAHRFAQRVPLSQLSWALSIARDSLWNYTAQECLHEDPVEFIGGVMLLQSLNSFFDRALYFVILGYQRAEHDESAAASSLGLKRPA